MAISEHVDIYLPPRKPKSVLEMVRLMVRTDDQGGEYRDEFCEMRLFRPLFDGTWTLSWHCILEDDTRTTVHVYGCHTIDVAICRLTDKLRDLHKRLEAMCSCAP